MIVIILAIFAVAKAEEVVKVSLGHVDVHILEGNKLPVKYQPLVGNDEVATANGKKWGKVLLDHAATGIDIIPVLDPFYREELPPVPIGHSLVSGELKLKNLNVTGIRNVVLENLEIRMKNNRLDAILSATALWGEADYEVDIIIGIIPITYTGHASVLLKDLKVTAAASIVRKLYKGVPVYQLDGIDATVHLDDVQVVIQKVLWDTVTGIMSPEAMWDEAAKGIANAVRTQANIILRGFTTNAVKQYLLGNVSRNRP